HHSHRSKGFGNCGCSETCMRSALSRQVRTASGLCAATAARPGRCAMTKRMQQFHPGSVLPGAQMKTCARITGSWAPSMASRAKVGWYGAKRTVRVRCLQSTWNDRCERDLVAGRLLVACRACPEPDAQERPPETVCSSAGGR